MVKVQLDINKRSYDVTDNLFYFVHHRWHYFNGGGLAEEIDSCAVQSLWKNPGAYRRRNHDWAGTKTEVDSNDAATAFDGNETQEWICHRHYRKVIF